MCSRRRVRKARKGVKNLLHESQGSTESKWEWETDSNIKNKLAFEFHN